MDIDNATGAQIEPETPEESPRVVDLKTRKAHKEAQPRARRVPPKPASEGLSGVLSQGQQAAQSADVAVSNASAAVGTALGAVGDAVDASAQAAGEVFNLGKWIVIGLIAVWLFKAEG